MTKKLHSYIHRRSGDINVEVVRTMIRDGADPYWRDTGQNNMMRLLIRNLPNTSGNINDALTLDVTVCLSDIQFAIRRAEKDWVSALVKRNMDNLDEQSVFGLYMDCLSSYKSPICYSHRPDLLSIMQTIRRITGFKPRTTCLMSAMNLTLLEVSELLIDLGTPVENSLVPFHKFNHFQLTIKLLQHGVDPNFVNEKGVSILMSCITRYHAENSNLGDIVTALSLGANPNFRSSNGQTPLTLACMMNITHIKVKIRIILLLLQYGAGSSMIHGHGVDLRIIQTVEAFERYRLLLLAVMSEQSVLHPHDFPGELISIIVRNLIPKLDF